VAYGRKRAPERNVIMNIFERLAQYHSESRSTFILFTEFAALVATMMVFVGMAVLFSLLQ